MAAYCVLTIAAFFAIKVILLNYRDKASIEYPVLKVSPG